MSDKQYKFILISLITGFLIVTIVLFINVDWNYVCTSIWRFSKVFIGTCLIKGYPLF